MQLPTKNDILRELKVSFGTKREGDPFADAPYAGWLRNWDRYQTLLAMDEGDRDAFLELVLGFMTSGGGSTGLKVIKNMGAVTAFEVVCAVCEMEQLCERERLVAEAQQAAKDTGVWPELTSNYGKFSA